MYFTFLLMFFSDTKGLLFHGMYDTCQNNCIKGTILVREQSVHLVEGLSKTNLYQRSNVFFRIANKCTLISCDEFVRYNTSYFIQAL